MLLEHTSSGREIGTEIAVVQATSTFAKSFSVRVTKLAAAIRREHAATLVNAQTTLEHALRVGEDLEKAKAEIGHGPFTQWVENCCAMSARQARKYMQLWRNRNNLPDDAGINAAIEAIKTAPRADLNSKPHGSFSGRSGPEWYTKRKWIDLVKRSLPGKVIHLDPASCPEAQKVVQAKRFFSKHEKGLDQPWAGNVFLNPPYGQMLGWSKKLVDEIDAGHVPAAIMLALDSIDAKWNHIAGRAASAKCEVEGRLTFYGPDPKTSKTVDKTSRYGSIFFFFGDDPAEFEKNFETEGTIWIPHRKK